MDSGDDGERYEFESNLSGSGSCSDDGTDSDEELYSDDETQPANVELNSVENQIEGDFDRLIGNIRDTDIGGLNGPLKDIWDVSFQQSNTDFQDEIREASGIGRVKGKGKQRRRRRVGPALSHQVNALVGEGNSAFLAGNVQEAIRVMMEVIRIEPRALSAWKLLITCHRAMNDNAKALKLAIMAAHLQHDADEWYELATESRQLGLNQQALYCYGKSAKLDSSSAGALWDRASLAREVGELQMARVAYLAMLKQFPHDVSILTELRHVLIEMGDLRLCAQLYQQAFDYYTSKFPFGPGEETQSNVVVDPQLMNTEESGQNRKDFSLLEVLVLADLYMSLHAYERVVKTVRAGCRWLQGRWRQKFWDSCPDDREFDLEGWVRDSGDDERAGAAGIRQGFYVLDINARHRLGVARLKMKDFQEGRMQVDVVLSQSVVEFSALFTEIADAYCECHMYAEARPIYEMLGADASTSSIHILMQAAACRNHLGDVQDAADVYEHVISVDPSNSEAKLHLATIYESQNDIRRALNLVHQVQDARKRSQVLDPTSMSDVQDRDAAASDGKDVSLFQEKKKKKGKQKAKGGQTMSKQERAELEQREEAEATRIHATLMELWDAAKRGEEPAVTKWLTGAETLVEMFQTAPMLFVSKGATTMRQKLSYVHRTKDQERQEDEMARRLELNIEDESKPRKGAGVVHFRGIHFDDWFTLMIQYSFLLTQSGQFDVADKLLQHILVSVPYQNRTSQDTLRIALVTCALHVNRLDSVLEHCRKLMVVHQFNNEPFRILLASLASGLPQAEHFINNTFQKFLLREIRICTAASKGDVVWNPPGRRYVMSTSTKVEEGDNDLEQADNVAANEQSGNQAIPKKPSKNNPLVMIMHGQTLTASKSYQSALFHLLHAFDNAPEDPLLSLSLAVATLGRSMQRQADNRNYLVTQTFAFLAKYRSIRRDDQSGCFVDEIEYNFGRAFHQLGLFSHATKHYENALQIAEKQQQDGNYNPECSIAREAAYNLSLIYGFTGASPIAEALYRRWLSF